MASITLHVAADHVELLQEELCMFQDVKRETVQVNEQLLVSGTGSPEVLSAHKETLRRIEALLDQVSCGRRGTEDSVTITGPHVLLHDVLCGMLLASTDRLSREAHRYPTEAVDLDQLSEHLRRIGSLVELLSVTGSATGGNETEQPAGAGGPADHSA